MTIFKCKMCGGDLIIQGDATVGECECCGTRQTFPRLDNDKKVNLYDRANHFRRNSDFDKAAAIYEQILNEDKDDAEAYWSLILCRYGIDYVEDPVTGKRIPTIRRAQYTSIFADEDYKSAIEKASPEQKVVYEEEAQTIDNIQKGILAISEKEEPFDVFICYKESDDNGQRTVDSVLANDLYHQLTQEGLKVFFARITLEDKLGQEYEPYIFAALNSAKVMVVLGTKPAYFNAVWVKNEWSRYLSLIRLGQKKTLIPAYKGMDPYDLPEEFSHLQAQDMDKLGFMQDLLRGINKIVNEDKLKNANKNIDSAKQQAINTNEIALVKRGKMALEDREWNKAQGFFDDLLSHVNAECAQAYFGQQLAEIKLSNRQEFINYFLNKYSESKVVRRLAGEVATDRINATIEKYAIKDYLEAEVLLNLYVYYRGYDTELDSLNQLKADETAELNSMKNLARAKQYASGEFKKELDEALKTISDALDTRIAEATARDNDNIARITSEYAQVLDAADAKALELYNEAESRRNAEYMSIINRMNTAATVPDFTECHERFSALGNYMAAAVMANNCTVEINKIYEHERMVREQELAAQRAEEERLRIEEETRLANEEKARKKRKLIIILSAIGVGIIAIAALVLYLVFGR